MISRRRARPGNPKTAVAYIRVSTEDQRLGPEAQVAAVTAWAHANGVTIVATYTDQGVSGGSDIQERPGLIGALGELRAAKAGVLLIAKRDRIARDVAVAATIERAVEVSGAKVISADGAGNGDGPADAFMRTILDAAAAYERALIRARTKAALAAKRTRGERAGNIPFGFHADDKGRLFPERQEQAVIAELCALRAAGLTLRAIAEKCAERKLLSRRGKPLQLTQVARLLKRPLPDIAHLSVSTSTRRLT